jgi:hypothetical protein
MGNAYYFLSDVLGGQNKIDISARYRALGHIRMPCRLQLLLRDGDAPHILYAAQRRCPVAVIAGDDDGRPSPQQVRTAELGGTRSFPKCPGCNADGSRADICFLILDTRLEHHVW